MSMSAIKQEIEANHAPIKGDVTVLDALLNKIPTFRYVLKFVCSFFLHLSDRNCHFCVRSELSMLHMEALNKFKMEHPHYVFPALYKELFSMDSQQDLT